MLWWGGHKQKHKKIKTLRSSYGYAYVAVISSGDMVGIGIKCSLIG
jgi:hypothetical protein